MDAAEDDEAVQVDGAMQLLEERTLENVQNAHVRVKQRKQRLDVVDRFLVLLRFLLRPVSVRGFIRGFSRGIIRRMIGGII